MKHEPITSEQREAIDRYASDHGYKWKEQLFIDWLCAGSTWNGPYHLLQQIRNSHGPRWLVDYNTRDEVEAHRDHIARHPEAEGPL